MLRHIIPWWLAVLIVGRDLVLLRTLPALRRRGLTALPVHYLGKAATFNLLYAFPLLLLGSHAGTLSASPSRSPGRSRSGAPGCTCGPVGCT